MAGKIIAKSRDLLLNGLALPEDPKQQLPEIYNEIIKSKKNRTTHEGKLMAEQAVVTLGFENDYSLTETVPKKYWGLVRSSS